MTLPSLLMTLHLSHMGLTDGLTFIRDTSLSFAAPDDPTFRQIVWAHFDFYRVTGDNLDIIHTKLTRDIRGDNMPVAELNFEIGVG